MVVRYTTRGQDDHFVESRMGASTDGGQNGGTGVSIRVTLDWSDSERSVWLANRDASVDTGDY